MHFSKHYFITITFTVLANLVILTTAYFGTYLEEFNRMFIFINLYI